jgi:hypothetical protein
MQGQKADTAQTVRRRRVFYIPGYDPFPPRRYRELFRKESTLQAGISGYEISQSNGTATGWQAQATIDGKTTDAQFKVLEWSNIVQGSMDGGIVQTYLVMLRTIMIYIGTGAFFRLLRLRKGPVIAALYPIFFLLGQALLAALLAYGAYRLLGPLHWAVGGFVAIVIAYVCLEWFRRKDAKFFAYYLMHDYAYSAKNLGATPPALQAKIDAFADQVLAALNEGNDEVLVVGHSSGAHIAVGVLAQIIRRLDSGPREGAATLSFLSLGHVVPMVSFLPRANGLRQDLFELCNEHRLTWVDVTAPGDGCTFALCDPVGVSGSAPDSGSKKWPLVFSAQFTQSLKSETWKRLRWRFFRLHFQYLCAFDNPKDYDYFQITCGPVTLNERYQNRTSSKSRIEHSLSPYTSRCRP